MYLAAVFGADFIIVIFVALTLFGTPILAFVDMVSHSKADFAVAGTSKVAWVTVIVVGWFLGFGIFLAIYYLVGVRPKLNRVAEQAQIT